MTLSVTVEVEGWTTIGTACIEAVELARRLGASVSFMFNGERILVSHDSDPEEARQRYVAAIDERRCELCGSLMPPGATQASPIRHVNPKNKYLCAS